MMDAREKYIRRAIDLAYLVEDEGARNLIDHLRTTPEGFALVPVPEWVPVGERLPVVPEGERSCPIWVASTQDVLQDRFHPCDAEWWKSIKHHYTHWSYRYIEPTPRMITEGVLSVIGRDDLPDLTRDEVEAIYMAMIAVAHKEFNERPE